MLMGRQTSPLPLSLKPVNEMFSYISIYIYHYINRESGSACIRVWMLQKRRESSYVCVWGRDNSPWQRHVINHPLPWLCCHFPAVELAAAGSRKKLSGCGAHLLKNDLHRDRNERVQGWRWVKDASAPFAERSENEGQLRDQLSDRLVTSSSHQVEN